jgi:hypothetical protein
MNPTHDRISIYIYTLHVCSFILSPMTLATTETYQLPLHPRLRLLPASGARGPRDQHTTYPPVIPFKLGDRVRSKALSFYQVRPLIGAFSPCRLGSSHSSSCRQRVFFYYSQRSILAAYQRGYNHRSSPCYYRCFLKSGVRNRSLTDEGLERSEYDVYLDFNCLLCYRVPRCVNAANRDG